MLADPASQFRDYLDAQIERVAKRLLGNQMANVAGQLNGVTTSDGHRTLNFLGAGVNVVDNAANRSMDISIPGTPISTTPTTVATFTVTARVLDLWNGSTNNSPAAGWQNVGFNDSTWSLPNAGGNYVGITADDGVHGATPILLTGGSFKNFLQRQTFTLPAGTITAATLSYAFDNLNQGAAVWVNGTSITGSGLHDATGVTVSTGLLTAGGSNLIACECGNNAVPNTDMGARVRLAVTYVGSAVTQAYINIQEQQNTGIDAGGFTSGAFRTRLLNTIPQDPSNLASLSGNQIVLPGGQYRCRIACPAFAVDHHQARLYDITHSVPLLGGSNAYANAATSGFSHSFVAGLFTLSGSTTLEVQHRCVTTKASNGFGPNMNFGNAEVYCVAEFWKLT